MGKAKYPITDHFDGKKFLNPGGPGPKKFSDVWKFARYPATPWPQNVENKGKPEILPVVNQGKMHLTFVNHSTFLVQVSGLNILTDPVWSERCSPVSFAGPKRHREPGLPFEQLPRIDIVVVSHNHYDHMDLPTLKRLNEKFKPVFIVPLANSEPLRSVGIENIVELDWWQSQEFTLPQGGEKVRVTATPAQHWSARGLFDRFDMLWAGFFVDAGKHKVLFTGDSGYGPLFKEIRDRLGAPTVALLPIGAYEPRWFMKDNHMNPEEAVKAHLDLEAENSIAMHYGTFNLARETMDAPVLALQEAREKLKVSPQRFRIMEFGETAKYGI